MATKTENLPALRQKTERINEIVRACQTELVQSFGNRFLRAVTMAGAITELRQALTPDIIRQLSSLQGTPVGFMTDKKPGEAPYPDDVVKECVLEGLMRGLNPYNNEFNILAGRFYITKNGMTNMVLSFPGLSQYREEYDPPELPPGEWKPGNNGKNYPVAKTCIVTCRASWLLNSQPHELSAEIPIICYPNTAVDAVLGKANRKLKSRVHERLTGLAVANFYEEAERQDEVSTTTKRAATSALASLAMDGPEKESGQDPIDAEIVDEQPAAKEKAKPEPKAKKPSNLSKDGEVQFPDAPDAEPNKFVEALRTYAKQLAALDNISEGEACAKYFSGVMEGYKYVPANADWFGAGDTEERRARRLSAAETHCCGVEDMGGIKAFWEAFNK